MKTVVTDTSVFIKWLNKDNEQSLEKADKILQEVKNGQTQIFVPELLKYELGNVLLKGKQLTPDQALISLGTAYSLPVTFIADSEQQAKDTYTLAYNYGISYYDASFMSVAKNYNATLVTDNLKHQSKAPEIKVVALKDY
ncbi:type II toxin-antitoxin system VapC family toxin [Patescibacteria group bacterium]|nr:type II toxin-antitoxin system VapC family toxin [Patescibacteria group bacterium]